MALTKIKSSVLDAPSVTVALASDTTVGGVGASITTAQSTANTAQSTANTAQSTANTADTRSKIYDIASGTVGKPANAAVIVRFIAPRSFTLPIGLTGSYVKAGVAATGAHVYTIKKNGTGVGTMDFAVAATNGTFTFTSLTSFVTGDILTIEAPATADATLSDLYFTLAATLV
jgi:hypothetical protein